MKKYKGQMTTDEISGGSPYGASTITGGAGERMPSENELQLAASQGEYVAEIAKKELEIDALKKQIQDLQSQNSGTTVSSSDAQSSDFALQMRLLKAKEEALTLKGELLGIYEEK